MLEQTLKRYVSMPGVVDQLEREMKDAIQAIKARMFEACVEEAFLNARGEERLWLGRIRDAIREMGASTVYQIGRAAAFPEAYATTVTQDGGAVKMRAAIHNKTDMFMTREDDQALKEGRVNAEIL